MIPFPDKKYKIIYADPPWEYDDKANAGNRGASHKYNTLPAYKISNLLDVNSISDNDSVCFMWATMPLIQNAIWLMSEWGFQYKTVAFVWVKKNSNGTRFLGMGNWTRANAELVLLGTKGRPKRKHADVSQIVESIPNKHSKKSDIVRNKIIRLCGDLSRIELFARTKVHGWDTWGNDEKLQLQPLEEYFV